MQSSSLLEVMHRRILHYANIAKAEGNREKNLFFGKLPRRILYYSNIAKAESRDKWKRSFRIWICRGAAYIVKICANMHYLGNNQHEGKQKIPIFGPRTPHRAKSTAQIHVFFPERPKTGEIRRICT